LNKLNKEDCKILTVEDPAEYNFKGINQVNVKDEVGMTFASALRSFLRQDPDIIMVGEIRDLETAEIAIKAAMTGHLVFSTLHTNDAPGAISRLLDFGVEPYLVSSSLLAIMAQRLVRRVCPDCKEQYTPGAHELRELGLLGGEDGFDLGDQKFYMGAGCSKCFQTGYRGRTGLYELMMVNDDIKELIYKRESAGIIKKVALEAGLQTLRMDGARKVLNGETTIAEVLRVTQADIL
ncbi:MAG: Flp pilus assembly complex ATPase component TadA, partial [Planctomycetes bacterium]|nr:Flp pilus assembly complex ATPase component TadA [Planctomycetota bacterium]